MARNYTKKEIEYLINAERAFIKKELDKGEDHWEIKTIPMERCIVLYERYKNHPRYKDEYKSLEDFIEREAEKKVFVGGADMNNVKRHQEKLDGLLQDLDVITKGIFIKEYVSEEHITGQHRSDSGTRTQTIKEFELDGNRVGLIVDSKFESIDTTNGFIESVEMGL